MKNATHCVVNCVEPEQGVFITQVGKFTSIYMPFQRLEKNYALHSELNGQLFASKYLPVLPNEAELARELERQHVLEGGVK